MPGQEGDGGFVEPGPSINVDSIDNVLAVGWLGKAILACGSEEQTAIGRKGQSSEEARKSFACVDVGLSNP